MTAAWDAFVASLDVDTLRREQAAVHGDLNAERFGSREHHEMVHAHEYIAADFWRRMRGEESDIERAQRRQRMRQRDERIAAAARAAYEQHVADGYALAQQDIEIARLVEHYQSRGRTA